MDNQRLMEGNEMDDDLRKIDKKAGITRKNRKFLLYTVLLAVYFLTVIILEAFGIITPLMRRILVSVVIIVLIVLYVTFRTKKR